MTDEQAKHRNNNSTMMTIIKHTRRSKNKLHPLRWQG